MFTDKKHSCRILLYGSFLLPLLLFSGCSPALWDAEKVLENKWKKEVSDGVIKIRSFKETSTQYDDKFSEKLFVVGYEAEIEYLKDVDISPKGNELWRKNRKKGEIVKEEGVMFFRKTDKGWVYHGTKVFRF